MSTLTLPFTALFLASIAIFGSQRNRDNLDSLSVRFSYLTTSERIIINLIPLLGILFLLFLHSRTKLIQNIFSHKIRLNVFWGFGFVLIFIFNFSWTPAIFNQISRIYSWIGIGHLKPGFADWLGVLKGINTVNEPGEFFTIDCPGSCMQYRWQYPSLLLKLSFIDDLSSYRQISALIVFLIFTIVFFRVFNLLNSGSILGIFFVSSPALLLLFERMNPEIIVIVLLPILAHYVFNERSLLISILLISIMAEIKFFPIILFMYLFLSFYRKWKYLFIVLFSFTAMCILLLQDLYLIGSSNLIAGYAATFGLIGLTSFAQGLPEPMMTFQQIPVLLIILIFLLYFVYLGTRIKVDSISDYRFRYFENLFLISSSLFIFSWLTNSNYIYRASLLIWIIPFFIILYENNSKIVFFWFVVTLFGCFTLPVTLAPIRNLLFSVSASIMLGLLLVVGRKLFLKDGLKTNLEAN
jgi:hypothetical protein